MRKIQLTEQSIYYDDISMPKGFEINNDELCLKAFEGYIKGKHFIHSKEWEKLNTYIIENMRLRYKRALENRDKYNHIYLPNEITEPQLNIDYTDLPKSADWILLYGVRVKDCNVTILYDDNRKKNLKWTIPLTDNKFIMFPASNYYFISNTQKADLNFIQFNTYVTIGE